MCEDCGCQDANTKYFEEHGDGHSHKHDHEHTHTHDKSDSKHISIEQDVLQVNNEIAHKNHHWFHDHNMKVVNLISSPGTGNDQNTRAIGFGCDSLDLPGV